MGGREEVGEQAGGGEGQGELSSEIAVALPYLNVS